MTIFEKFETQSKILNVSIFIFCRNEIKLYVVVVVFVVIVVVVVVVVVALLVSFQTDPVLECLNVVMENNVAAE